MPPASRISAAGVCSDAGSIACRLYDDGVQQPRQARRSTATGIVAAVLGIVLFAWFVRGAGAVETWNKVRQVGWGLAIISASAGLRFGARAVAWSVCIEPPHVLPIREAFAGVLCGDA